MCELIKLLNITDAQLRADNDPAIQALARESKQARLPAKTDVPEGHMKDSLPINGSC